jgi:molecular chaperone HscB
MTTFFDVLGLRRSFHLDRAELENRFLELSKKWHPDRFAKAAPRDRLEAMTKTTELNDALRVLRDDVKRAEYLLKLEGLDVADERPPMDGQPDKRMKADPSLLMEIMELREELSEAKAANDQAHVDSLTTRVMSLRDAALQKIDAGLLAFERADKSKLDVVAQALIALRYYKRFLDEAEGVE